MGLSDAERQARRRAKRDAELDALREKHKRELYEALKESTKLRELVRAIQRLAATVDKSGPVRLKGTLNNGAYNKIRFALQPDTYQSLSEAERNAAFQQWEELRPVVMEADLIASLKAFMARHMP